MLGLRAKAGLAERIRGTYEEIAAKEPDIFVVSSDDSAVDTVGVFVHVLSEDTGLERQHFSIPYGIRASSQGEA